MRRLKYPSASLKLGVFSSGVTKFKESHIAEESGWSSKPTIASQREVVKIEIFVLTLAARTASSDQTRPREASRLFGDSKGFAVFAFGLASWHVVGLEEE